MKRNGMITNTKWTKWLWLIPFCAFFLCRAEAWASPAPPLDLKIAADRLLKQHQIERAIVLYERVLREDGEFANAHYNLATAYYLQGDLWKAMLSLEAFLRFRPDDAEALYNLGCLKLRVGAFEEAWHCFLRAENCPSTRLVSRKIKEALHFMKDLELQNPETKDLLAYLFTSSVESF